MSRPTFKDYITELRPSEMSSPLNEVEQGSYVTQPNSAPAPTDPKVGQLANHIQNVVMRPNEHGYTLEDWKDLQWALHADTDTKVYPFVIDRIKETFPRELGGMDDSLITTAILNIKDSDLGRNVAPGPAHQIGSHPNPGQRPSVHSDPPPGATPATGLAMDSSKARLVKALTEAYDDLAEPGTLAEAAVVEAINTYIDDTRTEPYHFTEEDWDNVQSLAEDELGSEYSEEIASQIGLKQDELHDTSNRSL